MTYTLFTFTGYINNHDEGYPALSGTDPRGVAERLLALSAIIGGEVIIPADAPGRLTLNWHLDALAGGR